MKTYLGRVVAALAGVLLALAPTAQAQHGGGLVQPAYAGRPPSPAAEATRPGPAL